MSGQRVYGNIAELSDSNTSFTEIGIAVSVMWIVVSQVLRLAQFV